MKRTLLALVLLALLLTACGTTVVERVVTATPLPATSTPEPTNTPEPTPTPTEVPRLTGIFNEKCGDALDYMAGNGYRLQKADYADGVYYYMDNGQLARLGINYLMTCENGSAAMAGIGLDLSNPAEVSDEYAAYLSAAGVPRSIAKSGAQFAIDSPLLQDATVEDGWYIGFSFSGDVVTILFARGDYVPTSSG